MALKRLADISAQLRSSSGFTHDGMTEGTGDKSAIGRIFSNLEYDLAHGFNSPQWASKEKPIAQGSQMAGISSIRQTAWSLRGL